ncbi:MAG TPA: carboxypeptidase regulatory-like domain-containing protein [Candidatus Angelobacter sp.]|nr:carboxypeptidase regulatory-like domain-containing protein [Candidatus Angelobacter sp.]
MRSTRLLACALFCLFLAGGMAHAQGVGASGNISGTVTDPSGAAIPHVAITALETDRGIRYSSTSDDAGRYQFVGLPPAAYDVTAQVSSFQTVVQKSVVVTVGGTAIVDFRLRVATAAETVEVSAQPPVVETERGSQSDTLTDRYITDLPIDRRDYLTFTLLMPGVSNSTRLADDQDFRVKQTPQSGLSFYGSNGRGNSVTVDGGEANDDAGGVRLTVSQDAVQEFQVNRSNYAADLGGATGASINIVTKSGTNDLHGSLYGYFRNDAMDARDPFAFSQALQPGGAFSFTAQGQPIKNSLSRYQYGGTLGGPIHKDKTFLFVGFEGLLQDSQNAVPLLTNSFIFAGPTAAAPTTFAPGDPRAAQQAIVSALAADPGNPFVPCINNPNGTITSLPAQTCAGALQSGLTVSPVTGLTPIQNGLNNFLINQFESNGGLFNYNTREYLVSGRLDHHFNDSNQVSFDYRYGHDLEQSPDVQSLTGFSAGSSIHTYDSTMLGSWYHEFSPTAQNEARIQWDYESFNVIPNEPGEVGLQIPGFANSLGTNIFLPNLTILRRYEFTDNVTMIRGTHTMKFGGTALLRGNHTESHTFFPGRFVFGELPGVALSPCLANPNGPVTANPQTAGCNLPSTLNPAAIDSLQATSLGAPQIFQQGFGNPAYPGYTRPLASVYWQDSWKVRSNFTLNYGLRYQADKQFLPLNSEYRDFAPRISFAWDPFSDHKTVIRGGYGIFYGPVDAQIPQVDLSLGVLNSNYSTVENQNNKQQVPDQVNNVVNTCGIAFTGSPFTGNGSSPCTRFISIYIDPLTPTGIPGLQNSAVVFQTLFATGKIQCTSPSAGNAACITPTDLAPFGIRVANSGALSPLQVIFSNPPNYRTPYSQQASLGIEREIGNGLSVSISGIYSHTQRLPVAIDTNLLPAPTSTVTLANGKNVSYRNWNTSPATDPLGGAEGLPCAPNPFACFVNPLIVQNNQYTSAASALYEGGIVEVKKRFGNHYTVFGNYTYSKAYDTSTDFNSDYGPQDPTNLGLDRALSEFDERHKLVIAGVFDSPWKESVLSGFQLSPIFSYHSGHPFNLLAGGEVNGNNHTTNERPIGAPRDSGLGPNYIDFDMRLTWQHKLGEKTNLQLTAEGFNLANRTNFASVNNEVGPFFGFTPGFTTFNVHGNAALSPSQPLGFTSALPKREIQLGLRLSF